MPIPAPRDFLRALVDAGLAAADPARAVPPHLPTPPRDGRTLVVGAGKAAAAMARAVEDAWPPDAPPPEGLVVTRYEHGVPLRHIECVEASHPVPDAAGREAAQRMLDMARGLGEGDLLICLISGGGSALLALPAEGLSLEDKQAVSKALLRSGADIAEMNCVRKHLSAVKGGRLAAAAHPARVAALLISDVPGDEPSTIASGPTVADPTTFADARAILDKYGIEPPEAVRRHLEAAADETPKPGDPRLAKVGNVVVARPQDSLEAMAAKAREVGVTPLILGDSIEGEAREVARVMSGIARQARIHGQPATPPCVLLSGGETTVTVRGQGRGGRNAEFLLALTVALDGAPATYAVACDSDGIDGSEDNAGAIAAPDSLERARAAGLDPKATLADNDGYGFFAKLDDLIVTGPTRTNVNDLRAIYVAERSV
ncbi:glycerate kinase type-2 family protein [Ferruginivarius sediminum]|uniref:Glycerate kinase n=1 Tax=Ferruginivarius sediminum TaxID=2661937 RepID=A0A369T8X8_9PROT|nr:glycerate kinase [Ferruginivarius sediminum]RDD61728.1 glycerate kinase [Ferruginivarius sediminum]